MFPSPAGLNPVDGITMRAQTILHREILHLHGLLILAISLLRTRFAILNPSFMDYITSPQIRHSDDQPGPSAASSSAPLDQLPTVDPLSTDIGLHIPVPDSGSMALNSTSTESQNTLEPPFPTARPHA